MYRRGWWLLWLGVMTLVACATASKEVAMSLQLTSSAFVHGERIPVRYTCDGEDLSPPLRWEDVPAGTQSLVLIMDDPDAPMGTWVHWVLYDLSPEMRDLVEGATGVGVDGVNSWRRTGYGGPCPPPGKAHRYFFKLYALDARLNLPPGATKAEVERAMQGHILAQGVLMGTYHR